MKSVAFYIIRGSRENRRYQSGDQCAVHLAIPIQLDDNVGSIRKGLDADLVIWSGHPLSIMSRCEQTWIDGRRYFDIEEDTQARKQVDERRAALIQKVLASEEKMLAPGKKLPEAADLWPSEDIFCTHSHDEEDR